MSSDEARIILEAFEDKIAIVLEELADVKNRMATKDDIRDLSDKIEITQKALQATNEDLLKQGREIVLLKQQAV